MMRAEKVIGDLPPAKIEFLKANRDDISRIVEEENSRRVKSDVDPVTNEDIDTGIDEMMALVSRGGNINQFRFKIHDLPKPSDMAAARQSRSLKKDKEPVSYSFDVEICSNGFLLKTRQGDKVDSFIFKTEQELLAIFKRCIPQLHK